MEIILHQNIKYLPIPFNSCIIFHYIDVATIYLTISYCYAFRLFLIFYKYRKICFEQLSIEIISHMLEQWQDKFLQVKLLDQSICPLMVYIYTAKSPMIVLQQFKLWAVKLKYLFNHAITNSKSHSIFPNLICEKDTLL